MNCKKAQKYKIERWVAGEIEAEEYRTFADHLENCQTCRNYQVELTRDKQDFLIKHPFSQFSEKHISQKSTLSAKRWNWKQVAVPVFASIVIALLILPTRIDKSESGSGDIIYKGKESLSLIVRRGDDIFPAEKKMKFEAGDEVQLNIPISYLPYRYQMLLSLDGQGVLSQYPADFEGVEGLIDSASSSYPFPQTMILDEAPGFEILFLFFSNQPINVGHWVTQIIDAYQPETKPELILKQFRLNEIPENIKMLTAILDKNNPNL